MCGIIGVLGKSTVAPRILEGLRRLEYRGYDSAGIATLMDSRIERRRASGKLSALASALERDPLPGNAGIGHTRWATHGAPSERNAHPHSDARVAVVHNGIIENFAALRNELAGLGRPCESETDSETIVHLLSHYLETENVPPQQALAKTLDRLKGAFAIVALIAGEEDLLLAACSGSPLAIGRGDGEAFVGSDALALAPFTSRITYLRDGDWAVISRDGHAIYDASGKGVERKETISAVSGALVDKEGHRHFMAKEIHEQPEVVGHTLAAFIDPAARRLRETALEFDFSACDRLTISGCGTAYYAGQIAKYWFESVARLPCDTDIASELRYRSVARSGNSASLFISQSGETADTLAAMRAARADGVRAAALVNVSESTIAREADHAFHIAAGPEIGVASTKAFTCQLAALACLAVAAARQRGHIDENEEEKLLDQLLTAPRLLSEALKSAPEIERIAGHIAKRANVLYIGRGPSFPLALEGALKLKEISYIHAEGYAAGELKHGPIALIDEKTPIVVVAPSDAYFEKTVSNMHEAAARGGAPLLISDARGIEEAGDVWESIICPAADGLALPIVLAVPIQLLAYYTAAAKGTDVDQPRNLAKSVTVE